jgi:hypothetical protein
MKACLAHPSWGALLYQQNHGAIFPRARQAHNEGATALVFPDFHPLNDLWKKMKKAAMHLKHFPEFTRLQAEVDRAFLPFATTLHEMTALMTRYCESLRVMAASWSTKHFLKIYSFPHDLPPYNTTSRYVRGITDRLEVR